MQPSIVNHHSYRLTTHLFRLRLTCTSLGRQLWLARARHDGHLRGRSCLSVPDIRDSVDGALSCVTYIRDSVPGIRDSRGVPVARAAVDPARGWARGAGRSLITKVDTILCTEPSGTGSLRFGMETRSGVFLTWRGTRCCESTPVPPRVHRARSGLITFSRYRLESSRVRPAGPHPRFRRHAAACNS